MSAALHKRFHLPRRYIEDNNVRIVEGLRIGLAQREQNALAPGQSAGIAVRPLAFREVDFGGFCWLPTGRCDAQESSGNAGNKIDHVIRRPCRAYTRSVANVS